ncbi:hypothetical protein DWU98_21420 [Dyella monticola]|uniref:Uncharacterized protein n=1 Tax=Dyella monticola TaxID=1927958 RepID=A0A370WRV1_9GAMM|nr:hypothetical protein [Dyella monticola]RDS78726.1 hypothetical protein DWU98_21420 [Dyella monticola]
MIRSSDKKQYFKAYTTICLVGLTMSWTPISAGKKFSTGVKKLLVENNGNKCSVQLTDPYGALVYESVYSLYGDVPEGNGKVKTVSLSMYFNCMSSDDAEKSSHFVARFDATQQVWVKDFSQVPEEDRESSEPYVKVFTLNGPNSLGVGITDVTLPAGDDKPYSIDFGFCLRHPPVMLCGSANGVAYVDKKGSTKYQDNVLPIALKIVKSIEFVDAPQVAPPTSSAAQSTEP